MTDDRLRTSRKDERGTAKRLGARQHAGSGSGSKKHDMHTTKALIENKTVLKGNKQITLKATDLKSLYYQAATQGRMPVLHISLDNRDWVLITETDYLEKVENQP